MKQSPQITARINAIAKELANGKERGNLLITFGKKWGISKTTFDRYLKDAKIQAQELQSKASKAADKVYIEQAAEAAKKAVMSRRKRLELLSNIASGDFVNEIKKPAWNHGSKKFEIITVRERPDHNGIIKAIAEINKMEGDYAAEKSEVTVNGFLDFLKETSNAG